MMSESPAFRAGLNLFESAESEDQRGILLERQLLRVEWNLYHGFQVNGLTVLGARSKVPAR